MPDPTPPSGFHHLAIQVRDLPGAERFYCGVLGLPVLRRWPWPDGRPGERSIWAALGADGSFLALEACEGGRDPQQFRDGRPGLHLLALRIERAEREAWEQRLAAAGAPVVHRSAYTLYVLDPEGNRVGLSHHPREA
jgi:catechol 2,3-dioxygenase-like lactoylglutathione lyase family enzyme